MKIIKEKNLDGFCGYPLGFSNGAIAGLRKTYLNQFKKQILQLNHLLIIIVLKSLNLFLKINSLNFNDKV